MVKNLRFCFCLSLLTSLVSMATAQVFVPVPNAQIIQQDPVDASQMWLATNGTLQKGEIPTAATGWVPTQTYPFTGRPGCLAITQKYAVMQVTNPDGSLAANTLVVVNLSTHLPAYSNPEAASTDGSITITFSGGGCAALPNGNVLLGSALNSTNTPNLRIAKLAILDPASGTMQYYDNTTPQEVYGIYAVPGTTKCAVSYRNYPLYYVAVVDTANMDAPVNFIPTSFPVTGQPAFADGNAFLSGGSTVGAIVNLTTLNVTQTTHGFVQYMQSAEDTTYTYVVASNQLAITDQTTGVSSLIAQFNFTGQNGPFTGIVVSRDPNLNMNHVVLLTHNVASPADQTGNFLVLTDQTRPASAVDAVVNVFSGQAGGATTIGTIAANEWVTIYGRELSPSATLATSAPLPTSLGSNNTNTTAKLQCSGQSPVPLATNYMGINQLNLLMPATLPPGCTVVTLVATTTFGNGTKVSTPPVQLQVAESALGVLQDQTTGNVWAFDPLTGALIQQAAPGQIITLYADGGGATQPCPANSSLQCVTATPSITIGGIAANILFFGLQPTYAGLYQINVEVPANVTAGTDPLPLSIMMGATAAPSAKIIIGPTP